jgi:REP element-mobilizing transposase RayT
MILGFHVIMTAYGFWLPNDPRGSWSDWVRQWELLRFGEATKVATRKSLAHRPHNHALRLAAKKALMYEPVSFTGIQAQKIGAGFSQACQTSGYVIWAASILPEHVHLVVARHKRPISQVAAHLKGKASERLALAELHPFQQFRTPGGDRVSAWTRRFWKVFLYSPEHVGNAVQYVRRNPLKEGKPEQRWSFVSAYNSW